MAAYIVDTKSFKVAQKYPDSAYASYDMSDNYGWYPDNQYLMLHDEDAAYEYWYECVSETGKFHEGLGISEDIKYEMFKEWIEE